MRLAKKVADMNKLYFTLFNKVNIGRPLRGNVQSMSGKIKKKENIVVFKS